jgi:WD40 repeat protein
MATATAIESETIDGFISYCRTDAAAAEELVRQAATLGRTLWLDTADLPPATVWRDELRRAIESAHAVICLLTADWLASSECQRELRIATELGKRVIPVKLTPVSPHASPADLRSLQWIDATTEPLDAVTARVISAIDNDYERVREHTRWTERAARWNSADRDGSLVARGRDLREAEAWLATAGADPSPTPLQIEFVSASRRAERRRGRVLLGAISTAAVIALVLAGLAVWQRGEAITQRNTAEARRLVAESQRLAAESQAELATDPEIALILASDGLRASPTTQSATALRQALSASLVRRTVPATASFWTLAPAADGRVVTTRGPHGRTLELRQGGAVLSTLDVGARVDDLITSADGTVGLATLEDGAVGWRIDGRDLVEINRARHVSLAAMSRSGNRWVVMDDRDHLFTSTPDAPTWARVTGLPRMPYMDYLTLSADGRTLAVGNGEKVAVSTSSRSFRMVRMSEFSDLWLTGDGRYLVGLRGSGRGEIVRISDRRVVRRLTDAMTATVSSGADVAVEGEHGVDIYALKTSRTRHLTRQDLHFSDGMTKASWEDSDMPWTDFAGLEFDASGNRLLTWEAAGVPQVWGVDDAFLLGQLPEGRGAALSKAWFMPGVATVVTQYEDSSLRVWAVPHRPVDTGIRPPLGPHDDNSWDVSSRMSVDPSGHITTMAGRTWVRSWSTRTGRSICTEHGGASVMLCATERAVSRALAGVGLVAAAPSPDGSRLAVLDRRGAVWMYAVGPSSDVGAHELWHTPRAPDFDREMVIAPLSWTPDERRLLVWRNDLSVVDASTGAVVRLHGRDGVSALDGRWLDDGRSVGYWNDDDALEVSSAITGQVLRVLPKGTGTSIMSGAHDHWIAVSEVASRGDVVKLVDTVDGSIDHTLWGGDGSMSALAISQDGGFVAGAQEDGGIHVWEARTGALVMSTSVGRYLTSITFARGDDELVVGVGDGSVRRLRCPVCQDGEALLELARTRITAPLDDEQATQFGLSPGQRDG